MATLNEISFNILNHLSGGRSTDNSYISLDQIKFNVNYYRALILHRDLDKAVHEYEGFYQEVDIPMNIITTGKYASKSRLPKILRLSHRYPIKVFTEDKDYPVHIHNSIRFDSYRRFTSGTPKAYFDNGKLVVLDSDYITSVSCKAIFENPSEAYIFNGEDPLTADDKEYPLSSDVLQRLSESIISRDVELLQIPPDVTHDNIPNTATGN